jgi:hypothetical protein
MCRRPCWARLAFLVLLFAIAFPSAIFTLCGFVNVDAETGQPVPVALSCGGSTTGPPPEDVEKAPEPDNRGKDPNPPQPPPPPPQPQQ